MRNVGRTDLPAEQRTALTKAIRWEWATIAYTLFTISLVALVLGNSQAMKTAWIEDMLSLIPQVSFLVALLFIRRKPTRSFPFGKHRAMTIGHLVAGVALLAVGGNLAVEAAIGLISGEHPTIGTLQLFGQTIWLGWLMVGVMLLIVIGPLIYGPAKLRLAPKLHNKLLFADADMARADWHTNAASIVGVLGVGIGLWWLDGAAAIFISIGIVLDGVRNTRFAIRDLMDERARTHDDKRTHPLVNAVLAEMLRQPWVRDAGVRMRDQGQVFHTEIFFVPTRRRPPRTETLHAAAERIAALDWKLQDISLIPVGRLPDEATRLE
ncbi:cobalt transporter [Pseudoclavibacter endophyticus]|uniref:Cation transporter n=1 Tax=Pseudoclavibacter endophyticus TaxID=1778590 RepID=A0A6H9WMA3_9MICO|nr:cation transporter [Pseudoclavibacter endophyticus]KAB1646880.1 cation transporter [Pseudoclavibacter endophyticus]GGA74752.1 cobalt transporter [Pseudoclavibacter endophyticus]